MKSRIALIILLISLLASLIWNLGNYPLSLEEPRRAFVALEMIYSGNYIVPTLMGAPYHAKPPLYEWVLVGLFKAAGSPSEWMVRLPSVLSLLLLAGLNYLLARRYLKKETALYGSLFILTCGGFYYYFSLIGEIDLFFSLLAWLGMASIFYFEDTGKPVALLFLVSYFFTALGFMTKGFPAIAFQGLTLVGWLIYKKKWKTLFSPWHFAGIGLFLLIVGSYFYAYHQQQSVNAYLLYLWSESSSRTILGSEAIKTLLIHLVRFPVETLAELMPWSLLLLFFTKDKAKESFKQNPLIAFCLFAFCLNYLLYWLSPGAKQRYIYALYPLILLPLAYWGTEAGKESAPARRFKAVTLVLVALMLLATVAAPLSQVPKYLVYFPRYAMVVMVILWAGYLLLLKELLVKKQNPFLILLIVLILARIGMDVFYIPIKAHKGSAASAYKTATEINALSQNQPLQAWGNGYIPYGVVFYLEKTRKEILPRSYEFKPGILYLANGTEIPPDTLIPLYQTQLKKDTIILLKKSEEPVQIKSLK